MNTWAQSQGVTFMNTPIGQISISAQRPGRKLLCVWFKGVRISRQEHPTLAQAQAEAITFLGEKT